MRRLVIFLLLIFSSAAQAERTGNDLYSKLKSTDASENLQGYAYLEGVLDSEDWYLTADIFSSFDAKNSKPKKFTISHICFGQNKVTLGQIKDIVLKYLEGHPEKRHIRAQALIRFALMEDFACANNPQQTDRK